MAWPSASRLALLGLGSLLAAACSRNRAAEPAPDMNTPVPSASMTTNAADRSRTWSWSQRVSRGQCVMDEARLTMYDDGTYVFHALVQSRDNNDRWQVSFSFMDRDRVLLEDLNTSMITFTMENANQRYRWVTTRQSDSGQPIDPSPQRGLRLGDLGAANLHAEC